MSEEPRHIALERQLAAEGWVLDSPYVLGCRQAPMLSMALWERPFHRPGSHGYWQTGVPHDPTHRDYDKRCDQVLVDMAQARGETWASTLRERDELRAEVSRVAMGCTRIRKTLDAVGEPHVVPYPLPKVGEAVDPYEASSRAGGRARPLDERVASLAERVRHLERRCADLMRDAEVACEEPCGSCGPCHLASERAEEGTL